MTIKLLAFTAQGWRLAQRLAAALGGEAARCEAGNTLAAWTEEAFSTADGLVFVGAAGIAVRAIAPHLRDKTKDPAVVAVDECGQWAIPLLSGHLGGANDLARKIGALCGALPVITTATDLHGLFAVDEWARHQGLAIQNPRRIKAVSAKLLAGRPVYYASDWEIRGTPPRGVFPANTKDCDFRLSFSPQGADALLLVPKIAVLGVGCKKGTPQEKLETAFSVLLRKCSLPASAVSLVCSLDIKKEEPGILAFCQSHGFPFQTFSARQLRAVEGTFSTSEFVARTTGVDNVCERSAVLGSGGKLIQKKMAMDGVTLALALKPFSPDWREGNG